MKILKAIGRWIHALARVFANEFSLVVHDQGVLIFFFALPLLYPIVYTLVYNKEVPREIPVAVVDNAMCADSRDFIQKVDATPAILVYDRVPNMADARRLMAEGKVYGVLDIPKDYSREIAAGRQSTVVFYSDMSLLLRYRTFLSALTELQIDMASEITAERANAMGDAGTAFASGSPVGNEAHLLGDREQGFASFVMPGIIILILQQSMVMGAAMIIGTSRDRRRRLGYDPREISGVSATAKSLGKALCYTVFYVPATIYILHFITEIFNLPRAGSPVDYLLFIFPLLLSSAFFGQVIGRFVSDRESCFPVIVFTSVVFLFLSGLTWPRYAMTAFCQWLGDIVPATWAVEGFIRINSNSATLAETQTPYIMLWVLTAVYFILSALLNRYNRASEK
jgi:ABC-2 type transport system permease protein